MQSLLTLLQDWTHDVALHRVIARHNLEAAAAEADDVAQAIDSREASHIEFSMFTSSKGRACE
jgi:hypothetical protein